MRGSPFTYLCVSRRFGKATWNQRAQPECSPRRHPLLLSFFQYASFEVPSRSKQIQRAPAIPTKRYTRTQVGFLTRPEVDALLAAPDMRTWSGRRDHALLLTSVQTGMRLSEMAGLKRQGVTLGTGAHVRVAGKGRKTRCIPLTEQTLGIVRNWLQETARADSGIVFPHARSGRVSADGVTYIHTKQIETARKTCPSLRKKRVTFRQLRHTSAMELLRAGFDGTMIALWLGHESPETPQIYLDADLELRKNAAERCPMTVSPEFAGLMTTAGLPQWIVAGQNNSEHCAAACCGGNLQIRTLLHHE
ncbi:MULTISPECIES: tyrosine-type recombinase/integrase [Paraburkholderia]|uniref:tyrosine-type recombinase/integrase n=1 Tax=Paraburkholderia TaxID=1822464 RepID=UPI0018F6DBD4|nr:MULTISPECIES: tyrosine-type recombinase/integrase [Paraburkholderia]